jgi:hypothetical protein
LLKELLKHTEPNHTDYASIKKALDGTVSVSSFLNERVLEKTNLKKYSKLCKEIIIADEPIRKELMQSYRKFIHDGMLQIAESTEVRVALNMLNQKYYCALLVS